MEEFTYTNPYSLADLRLHEKTFAERPMIKPWLQLCLYQSKGIKVVTERSDRHKIIFRCPGSREKEIAEGKHRRSITCPFKIRANFSHRSNQWNLVVLNQSHNHPVDPISPHDMNNGVGDTVADSVADEFFEHIPEKKVPINFKDKGIGGTKRRKPVKNPKEVRSKSRSKTPTRPNTKNIMEFDIPNHKEADLRNITKRDLLHEEFKLDDEVANTLGHRINDIIKQQISMNHMINEDSKANIIRTLINNILLEHKDTMGFSHDTNALLKNSMSAWFSTSPSLSNNPSANLIPLSPLLNDSDNDYQGSNHSPNGNHTTLDSLTLPGISSNFLINSSNQGNSNQSMNNGSNFVMPNQLQLLQIQNQNRQLPSFNSIQNNLPLSPNSNNTNVMMYSNSSVLPTPSNPTNTEKNISSPNINTAGVMNNNSTANISHSSSNANNSNSNYLYSNSNLTPNMNLLANNSFGLNIGVNSNGFTNSNSTSTLNPSHLLKNNPKNNLVSNTNLNNLLDKNGSSVNVNNYLGSLSNILTTNIPGVSSPNHNSISNQSIMKSFIGKEDPSLAYKMRNESDNET